MELNRIIIHDSAVVSENAIIGNNSCIWNNCQIREGVRIGQNCILGKDVYIDFDVGLGDNVKIQNGVQVYHGTSIGTGVFIGPGVIFTNDKRPRSINADGTLKKNDDWEVGEISVKDGASIGAGAVILTGVTIGKFALIGAGAVVTRDVADHALVVGNPARKIGYVCRCAHNLEDVGSGKWYCQDCDEIIHLNT